MPRVKRFDEQEVLERAMELFWKKGFAATSIQDLVAHLGINWASLYSTFGDKEQLFKRVLEHYKGVGTRGIRQFFTSQPNVKQGFKQLFEQAIEESVNDVDRKGCFVVNTATELIPGDTHILSTLEDNKCTFEAVFYDYLKSGQEAGQFETDQDLRALANLLFTFYNGLKVVAKIQPDRLALLQSAEVILSLLKQEGWPIDGLESGQEVCMDGWKIPLNFISFKVGNVTALFPENSIFVAVLIA